MMFINKYYYFWSDYLNSYCYFNLLRTWKSTFASFFSPLVQIRLR
jgi:hypothetical protein